MMGEIMQFPETVEEFMQQYKITDSEQIYTNGAELVPIFRMQQWFKAHKQRWIPCSERMPEKNDQWVLCLCVSGAIEVLKFDYTMWNWDAQYPGRCYMENYVTHWMPIAQLPKEVQGNEL